MDIIAQHGTLFLALACLFGFFMAWGIGANDVANAMGNLGRFARSPSPRRLIAMVFEFWAPTWRGRGHLHHTQGHYRRRGHGGAARADGVRHVVGAAGGGHLAADCQHAGLAGVDHHSIVGAIVGFAAVGISVDAIHWDKVLNIMASWVVSPVIAGTVSYCLFMSVKYLILDTDDPSTGPNGSSRCICGWWVS